MRILIALLLSCSAAWADYKPSTFVVVFEGKTGSGHGSGTCIANDGKGTSLICTNRHVVADSTSIWVISDAKLIKGTVVFINLPTEVDVACFTVPLLIPKVDLSLSDPVAPIAVQMNGRTSGSQTGKAIEMLELTYKDGSKFTYLSSDLLSIAGDSGAGVFNDKDELVAMNLGRIGSIADGQQIGVPVSHLRETLYSKCPTWFQRPVAK